ncbi:DUF7573 domain-containing protein [Halorarius litoreus]|uniref:DUF7573 domain-containing protein n=1 Tax=Halorarius litoreus TaxID=2962676 RepID=UPI0020CC2913|nr:hypothetical protein [Halorarius litoreus]
MSRDRSLDEFARSAPSDSADGDGASGDEAAEAEADSEDVDAADSSPAGEEPVDDVSPAVSTYAFAPDGAACDSCGAVVQKRWRDDAGLVCPDCKQW